MRQTLLVVAAAFSAITAAGAAQPQTTPPPAIPGVQQTPGPRAPAQPAAPVRDTGGRPPAAPTGTSTLTGIVTTYTGQPAAGARIMVGGEGPSRIAMTDARGRFSLTALRAGRYFVTASKPGYVTVTYGQRRVNSPGTAVPLGDGETRDIAIQLPRGGVITGMVLDERGEPAVNAFVRVMRFMPGAGERRPQQSGGDNTDDRGVYRVHSLQPGDYAVCATYRGSGPQNDAQRIQMELEGVRRAMANAPSAGARQQMAIRLADLEAQVPAQSEPATGYGTVCFPGSLPTASTAIAVSAGEEKSGIDLQLQITHVARIEGQVVVPPGVEPRSVQLNLVSADAAGTPVEPSFAQIDEQGKFVFQSIPPGGYKIVARSMPRNPGPPGPGSGPAQQPVRLWANADITVAGQDITGLVLELQRGATISGQVAIQATSTPPPADLSRVMITVLPSSPEPPSMMGGGISQAVVEANGRFTVNDVLPGSYRVTAGLAGAPASAPAWVVQSITVDGEDAADMPLDVKGRSITGMAVTLTDRITELSGLVVDDKGKPATEHTLVLYPVDEKYWFFQSRRIRTTRAGDDGRYSFRVVPPGDYRLATLLDPEAGAWYDKAVLSDLESTAVRISLAEGEKKIENVRVK